MNNRKRITCIDGFTMSVQGSERNYCEPQDNAGPYEAVEIGFPNAPEPLIAGYAEEPDMPTETVYGWVPVGIVQAVIIKHGGVVEGELPPFEITAKSSADLAEAMLEF